MQKIITILAVYMVFFPYMEAQTPIAKQWDKRYGGDYVDAFTSIIQTTDGGYILGGDSYSDISGDKSQNNWNSSYYDYWVIKVDSIGNKQWDKDFGGTKYESLSTILQSEGGYLFCGTTTSDSTGDVTQQARGTYDYWILKTDFNGNKLWDKRYGGSGGNALGSADKTFDGGYILAGFSDANISGDKSQPSWGEADYWVIKIDSIGNKQWDKRFGGNQNDVLFSVKQCQDGGYILGGYSYSGITGDKSEPNWTGAFPYPDYWVVKINALGIKEWDKTFGGTSYDELIALQQTLDGGYILGGLSKSGLSGNKTVPNWDTTNNTFDYWVIKIDSLGNKQWEKDYGGLSDEVKFGDIVQTNDKGYFLSGISYSNIGGDKTENNLGNTQTWALKIDSTGTIQWDKTILSSGLDGIGFGTGNNEYGASCLQSQDGCFVFANYSSAGIGGYKTQPNWDTTNTYPDYWMVKFCDTTILSNVSIEKINNLKIITYPNPFSNNISITIIEKSTGYIDIKIFNMLGKIVYRNRANSLGQIYSTKISLSNLPKGIFLVEIIINKKRTVQKIIKQ